jgi:uncharacterized protein (TIGR02271 family)
MANNPPAGDPEATVVIPVIAEQLRVGVRARDTGRGVRIHKTVSEHSQPIEQTLLRESVHVTRVPVDRIVPLSEAPVARQEGDTWVVPIVEEVLVVEKRLRIKEEVRIKRTTHADTYTDSVVLRAEQVSITRFDHNAEPEPNSSNGGIHHAPHTHRGI